MCQRHVATNGDIDTPCSGDPSKTLTKISEKHNNVVMVVIVWLLCAYLFVCFETGSQCVVLAGLKLTINNLHVK